MNAQALSKTCLLIISKQFYSFEKHIREALIAKGFDVTVSNDEYPEGMIGKILGKLQIPLIFPFTYKVVTEQFLNGKKYDIALIFKGRGMSKKLLERMRESADFIVGYNWDSFKLNRAPLKWYKFADKYYTFDYRDADKFSLPIVELFSASKSVTEDKIFKYEVSAVVRNHSGRLGYIDKVLSILKPSSIFLFVYELNIFTFIINFVKSPRLYFKYRQYISFKPLKYEAYSDAIKSSEFTIDYAHYTQTGITMRCFEAINTKTKIITNNKYTKRSIYFDDSNCIIFEGYEDANTLIRDYEQCKGRSYNVNVRTIGDFITELIRR